MAGFEVSTEDLWPWEYPFLLTGRRSPGRPGVAKGSLRELDGILWGAEGLDRASRQSSSDFKDLPSPRIEFPS